MNLLKKETLKLLSSHKKRMKLGTAAGPDDLCAEHIHYAMPTI